MEGNTPLLDDWGNPKKRRADKVHDILIGFFGGGAICLMAGGIAASINLPALIWFLVGAYILSILFFLIKGRAFIAIGIVLIVVLPLTVVGGCMYFIH